LLARCERVWRDGLRGGSHIQPKTSVKEWTQATISRKTDDSGALDTLFVDT
jgi:hypothetical protein